MGLLGNILVTIWFIIAFFMVVGVSTGDQEKAGRQFMLAVLWPLALALFIFILIWDMAEST